MLSKLRPSRGSTPNAADRRGLRWLGRRSIAAGRIGANLISFTPPMDQRALASMEREAGLGSGPFRVKPRRIFIEQFPEFADEEILAPCGRVQSVVVGWESARRRGVVPHPPVPPDGVFPRRACDHAGGVIGNREGSVIRPPGRRRRACAPRPGEKSSSSGGGRSGNGPNPAGCRGAGPTPPDTPRCSRAGMQAARDKG
jgi:hypothetical protein